MVTLLQPVALAEHCLLSELLYWVALKRFPRAISDLEDVEYRFSSEFEIFARSVVGSPVSFAECEFAGMRPNPRYAAFVDGLVENDFILLNRMKENIKDLAVENRDDLVAKSDELIIETRQIKEWDNEFKHFIDYYKAIIFVDLRDGKLIADSVTIFGSNEQELRKSTNRNEFRTDGL